MRTVDWPALAQPAFLLLITMLLAGNIALIAVGPLVTATVDRLLDDPGEAPAPRTGLLRWLPPVVYLLVALTLLGMYASAAAERGVAFGEAVLATVFGSHGLAAAVLGLLVGVPVLAAFVLRRLARRPGPVRLALDGQAARRFRGVAARHRRRRAVAAPDAVSLETPGRRPPTDPGFERLRTDGPNEYLQRGTIGVGAVVARRTGVPPGTLTVTDLTGLGARTVTLDAPARFCGKDLIGAIPVAEPIATAMVGDPGHQCVPLTTLAPDVVADLPAGMRAALAAGRVLPWTSQPLTALPGDPQVLLGEATALPSATNLPSLTPVPDIEQLQR